MIVSAVFVLFALATVSSVQAAPSGCPKVDGPDSVYIPHEDCGKFWQCSNGRPIEQVCPAGLHFNPKLNVCDWPQNVGCEESDPDSSGSSGSSDSSDESQGSKGSGEDSGGGDDEKPSEEDDDDSGSSDSSDGSKGSEENNNNSQGGDDSEGNGSEGNGSEGDDDSSSSSSSSSEEDGCPKVDGPDSVYLPHKDCSKFYQCSNGQKIEQNCPDGLHWNTDLNVCDWPENASCEDPSSVSSSSSESNGSKGSEENNNSEGGDDSEGNGSEGNGSEGDDDSSSSSSSSSEEDECPKVDGPDSVYLPHEDCNKFYQCSNGEKIEQPCPAGLHWNTDLNVCDWPENAGCDGSSSSSSSSESEGSKGSEEDNKSEGDDGSNGEDDSGGVSGDSSSSSSSSESDEGECPKVDGPDSVYLPHEDCNKFYQCSNGEKIEQPCPEGLHWNTDLNVCDWPQNAGCDGSSSSSSSSESEGSKGSEEENKSEGGDDSNGEDDSGGVSGDSSSSSSSSESDEGECPKVDGPDSVYLPHEDCNKFYQCSNGEKIEQPCPAGLHWNTDLNVCDWPENAGCDGSSSSSSSSESEGSKGSEEDNKSEGDDGSNGEDDSGGVSGDSSSSSSSSESDEGECPKVDGPDSVYFPHDDCGKFYQCSNGRKIEQICPDGLHFNPKLNVCDWPENAGCDGSSSSSSSSESDGSKGSEDDNKSEGGDDSNGEDDSGGVSGDSSSSSSESDEGECPKVDGPDSVYFPHDDCGKFYQCSNGRKIEQICPDGLHFNPKLNVCDWPQNAGCDDSSSSSSSSESEEESKERNILNMKM